MKLYHSPTSPFARKVVITAMEAGIASKVALETMAAVPTKPNLEYARTNPLMKVPALVRDDGSTLYDSIVICEYLDTLAGGSVFPRTGEARWDALRRHALADGITEAALLLRYETAVRPEALRWPEWVDGQWAKVDQALAVAEREVAAVGTSFDIGWISIVCALGYLDFRFAYRPWRPGHPALAAWTERIGERASVKATQPPPPA
jgi:glutathione S-transferase